MKDYIFMDDIYVDEDQVYDKIYIINESNAK